MYTRCQACHTVHPVNAALLARGQGRFRCGKCKKIGNALEALFDSWPDPGQAPPRPGSLPELGAPLQLAANAGDAVSDAAQEDAVAEGETNRPAPRRLLRAAWITAGIVVLVVIGLNLARFFGIPLWHEAVPQPAGEAAATANPPFRDLDRIEIVSREMIAHPARPGTLQLNATLVNRAERSQPYPDIEVTLLDIDNRVVGHRLFAPADYLSRTAALRRGMTPGAYVILSLDLPDPGVEAVGFELKFH